MRPLRPQGHSEIEAGGKFSRRPSANRECDECCPRSAVREFATSIKSCRCPILYFGTPVALISTLNPDGQTNLSVMSSAWALGDRVVLGLGCGGQALVNLERERECVINLPSPDLWAQVERLGPTTGREDIPEYKQQMGYEYEGNKFGRAGLTSLPSETVRPERVQECPLQLEARVVGIHVPAVGQEDTFRIVETQVTRVHAHQNVVISGTNYIDTDQWSPLLYVFRHYFGTGSELGKNFRAER